MNIPGKLLSQDGLFRPFATVRRLRVGGASADGVQRQLRPPVSAPELINADVGDDPEKPGPEIIAPQGGNSPERHDKRFLGVSSAACGAHHPQLEVVHAVLMNFHETIERVQVPGAASRKQVLIVDHSHMARIVPLSQKTPPGSHHQQHSALRPHRMLYCVGVPSVMRGRAMPRRRRSHRRRPQPAGTPAAMIHHEKTRTVRTAAIPSEMKARLLAQALVIARRMPVPFVVATAVAGTSDTVIMATSDRFSIRSIRPLVRSISTQTVFNRSWTCSTSPTLRA